jgi:hypothetical protein
MSDDKLTTFMPLAALETIDEETQFEKVIEADRRLAYNEIRRMLERAVQRELANVERDAAVARMATLHAQMAETVRVLAADRAIDAKQIVRLNESMNAMAAEINAQREQLAESKRRVTEVVARQEELAAMLDRMRLRMVDWDVEKSEP